MRKWNWLSLGLASALTLGLAGCGGESDGPFTRRVFGESSVVNGQLVQTWETQDLDGRVIEVGMSITDELIDSPPASGGTGPSGAVAVLQFPVATRSQTFFDHLELHWNFMGHEPPMYMKPHWDFHFYGIPVQGVWNIAPPDPEPGPTQAQIPGGYLYPGAAALVPQMGVHAVPTEDLQPGYDFQKTNIYGFYGNQTIFVEPMITQEFLRNKRSFNVHLPQPNIIGRNSRFPTRVVGRYIQSARKWEIVMSGFVNKN